MKSPMSVNYRGLEIGKVSFGAVDSDGLFEEREQGIFDFYAANRNRYRRVLDIGANIGIHSILMAQQGWDVTAYEPDPEHFGNLLTNLTKNEAAAGITFARQAVSDFSGRMPFVRVKGNTTSSHLKGDKEPYGEVEELEVSVVDCRPLFTRADFAKIDCEGHEARLLLTVTPEQNCDFMVEVGSVDNALAIYEHFQKQGRGMWAQQHGWARVTWYSLMPTHYTHGALFIGRHPPFMAEEEKQMEDLVAKQARKRAKQHEAWLRWYHGPKGQAYKQKRKERKALEEVAK